MKTKLLNVMVFLISSCIISCSGDDNTPPPSSNPGDTNTEFVIGSDAYVTPNAYLLLDDATTDGLYDRSFTFIFSDNDIVENSSFEVAYDTSTNHYTKFTCQLALEVSNENQIPLFTWTSNLPLNILAEGDHYTEIGISSYSNTYVVSGNNYGQPSVSTRYDHTALAIGAPAHNSPDHFLSINAFTYDLTARNGTIDCTYTYRDDNGVLVEGVYVGNY